jgi:hypothetical protein
MMVASASEPRSKTVTSSAFTVRKQALRLAACGILLAVAAFGCGKKPPEFGQVEGTVRVNGQPQARLLVRFLPDSAKGNDSPINSTGTTDAQGKFTLEHIYDNKPGPGALVGWHRVIIEDRSRGPTPQGQTPPPPLVPIEYSSPGSTPLFKEVKPGGQTIDLEVTK